MFEASRYRPSLDDIFPSSFVDGNHRHRHHYYHDHHDLYYYYYYYYYYDHAYHQHLHHHRSTMDLEELRHEIRRRTQERSELSRGAREVGEDLAHLPD